MNIDQLLNYLTEADVGDPNVQVYFDRLMMRLFESPPLLASFVGATTFNQGKDVIIQLEFNRVPREFHVDMTKIAGTREVQVVNYERESNHYTGLQIRLTTDDVTPKSQKEDPTDYPFKASPQLASDGSSAASVALR